MAKFKAMVRDRIRRTGETWQVAQLHVRIKSKHCVVCRHRDQGGGGMCKNENSPEFGAFVRRAGTCDEFEAVDV